MNYDVEEYVHYRIANAPVHAYPFPHFLLRPVFPDGFYERILGALPETDALTPIHESGAISEIDARTGERRRSAFKPRYLGDIGVLEAEEEAALGAQGGAWRSLAAWMLGDRFRDLIVAKFLPGIQARFGPQTRLRTEVEIRFVRDMTDYSIAPHTDKPDKLVSLLFYLPADETLGELGTSLYVPKDPALRCDGSVRHPFELFRKVMTAPFLPNSLFGFVKTDQAFHGVEVIERPAVERNLLLYNIYVRKLMRPAPPEGA